MIPLRPIRLLLVALLAVTTAFCVDTTSDTADELLPDQTQDRCSALNKTALAMIAFEVVKLAYGKEISGLEELKYDDLPAGLRTPLEASPETYAPHLMCILLELFAELDPIPHLEIRCFGPDRCVLKHTIRGITFLADRAARAYMGAIDLVGDNIENIETVKWRIRNHRYTKTASRMTEEQARAIFESIKEKFGPFVQELKELERKDVAPLIIRLIKENPRTTAFHFASLILSFASGSVVTSVLGRLGFGTLGPRMASFAAKYQSAHGTPWAFRAAQSAGMHGKYRPIFEGAARAWGAFNEISFEAWKWARKNGTTGNAGGSGL